MHGDTRGTDLVTLVADRFLGGGTQGLLVGVFGRGTVAAYDLFAALNAHQPFGFSGVPGDFHSIGAHIYLQGELRYIVVQWTVLGELEQEGTARRSNRMRGR